VIGPCDLERVSVGEFLVAGEGCGECEECGEEVAIALVSQGQAAVAAEPGDGAFDDPAVPTQPGRRLDAAAGDAVADPAFAQCPVAIGNVVGLVGVDLRWFAAAWSAPGADLREALKERLERL
jgi:hypothetical protein